MSIRVEIYGSNGCKFCDFAKALFSRLDIPYIYYNLTEDRWRRSEFDRRTNGARTVPQIFIDNVLYPSYDVVKQMNESGELAKMFPKKRVKNED